MEQQPFATPCRDDGSIRITSGERLTIDHAAAFALCLREALLAAQRVEVEFAAECSVDVTTMQTLCSACKTAAAAGKSLVCHGAEPPALRQLITAAGAMRPGPCRHNNGNPCPWFGGTAHGETDTSTVSST